jgi:hypothetical protein
MPLFLSVSHTMLMLIKVLEADEEDDSDAVNVHE